MRYFVIIIVFVLTFTALRTAWGYCPQDTLDRGNCDTMYIEPWSADVADSVWTRPGPYFIRVPIYVTADVNDVWDSISGFVSPLCYTHTNPTKYCSVSTYWNTTLWSVSKLPRSIFRHLPRNDDPQVHNWMMDLYDLGEGGEWNFIMLELSSDSGNVYTGNPPPNDSVMMPAHFWLMLIPAGPEDTRFGTGTHTLLFTMTFKLQDSMSVCIDTCLWPPLNHLSWCIYPEGGGDVVAKIPRIGSPHDPTSYKTCFPFPTVCVVDPTSLNFGNVAIGDSSDLTFMITNNDLETLSGTVTETCDEYSLVGDVVYNLSTWQSKTFTVRFTPTSSGIKYCDIITGNDLCRDVSCSGEAVFPPLFSDPVKYAVGDAPFAVFCADLDGNGDLDLAVPNWFGNNVSILKNNGNGTFQDKVDYDCGNNTSYVFCADLDGDGDLDLAVTNAEDNNVSILKNYGDGTFQSRVNFGVGDYPQFVFCADLDDDGDLDLAVVNALTNNVSILKNNGDGTFQPKSDYSTGNAPYSVFCADLDDDGDLDLAVANVTSDNISILKNNGDGTFQAKSDYGAGNDPYSVFCADLDDDGDLDLAVANWFSNNVSILKNNGDGTFQVKVDYDCVNSPAWVSCADLDGDGDLDLAITNWFSNNISILKNNGDGTFQAKVDYNCEGYLSSVFCADLDRDGDFDLAVTNVNTDSVSILKNLSQIPANQPPWAFSLISPADEDTTFQPMTFRWHIPYDPNFGDQMRYDLYVSTTSGFEPESTNIDSNLYVSKHTIVLDRGTYFWKIKTKDNWGAETWSTQTWSFCALYLYGDANADGVVDVGDVVYLINYLFKNGPFPNPLQTGDVNCDGLVDVGDVVYLINYLFKAGPPPCE